MSFLKSATLTFKAEILNVSPYLLSQAVTLVARSSTKALRGVSAAKMALSIIPGMDLLIRSLSDQLNRPTILSLGS
ncbi:hypothetical protein H5410_031988 [Solanum commersonii]|uniref:Uncharacterized protein n=1 Tax=Solanum commersonii TaxID=4109 RepID=A0A9J5YJS3_SOLCO|nr:hypothetical protein H5410_031988 [Solanum commersonii]